MSDSFRHNIVASAVSSPLKLSSHHHRPVLQSKFLIYVARTVTESVTNHTTFCVSLHWARFKLVGGVFRNRYCSASDTVGYPISVTAQHPQEKVGAWYAIN